MRNFLLGVFAGLLLAAAGASAYWAVCVEMDYRTNIREGLPLHVAYVTW